MARNAFKRYQPYYRYAAAPPTGTYDPSLDAQVRAAQRGLQDLQLQTEQSGERRASDYGLAKAQTLINTTQRGQDITRNQRISTENLNAQVTNARAQANQSLSDLSRQFRMLGQRQGQAIGARGLDQGYAPGAGATAAAAATRAGNQGYEAGRVTTGLNRALQAVNVQRQRVTEGTGIDQARLKSANDRQVASLALQYQRQGQDARTALAKAKRETQFLGQDVAAQRYYQAAGTGYTPPRRPHNEFTSPYGTTYRVVKVRGKTYYVLPSGHHTTRKPA